MSTVPQRLGKYELQGRLGRGGMAEVWKAFDTQLERHVAIKILRADLQNDPDFMKRFVREAQVVASLHHPNIVQVHDFQIAPPELDNTSAYMVMDYIEGQTLTEFIYQTSRIGKFPPAPEIVYLFTRICSAVDYAHRHGMIHRDIKPANILLDKRSISRYELGTPFLTDFGIVKLAGASTVTRSGAWLGTPLYISPEQALGHPGNERSDIYSLGVILYEICTGVRPFQGEHIAAIIMQHINTMPTFPALINPQVTPALTEVIMCALAKDPAARFPNASSMATALAQAFHLPSPTPPNPVTPVIYTLNEHISSRSPSSVMTPSTSQLAVGEVLSDIPDGYMTPRNSASDSSTGEIQNQHPQSTVQSPLPPELSSTPLPAPRRRRRGLYAALTCLLLLIIVGSGAGVFHFASHTETGSTATPLAPLQQAGFVAFMNSGLFNSDNSQGIEDELHVSLQHISNPAPGKNYYAWLLSDNNQGRGTSLLVQKLSISQGNVDVTYKDTQHSNLLGRYSRFLITEENANNVPTQPSSDRHTWRYYAEIPQTASSTSGFLDPGMLYYLRNMLYLNHNLNPPGSITAGGGATWLLRNTGRVLDEANNAMLSWNSRNFRALRGHLANALAYIDGITYMHNDLPTGIPPVTVGPDLNQLALINSYQPDYQSMIDYNLTGIFKSSSTPPDKGTLANNLDIALDSNMHNWLQKVHDDAEQLIRMNDAQLLQASSVLKDLVTQAGYAYNGQIDPVTGKGQQGVQQLYTSIQSLATLDVKPFS